MKTIIKNATIFTQNRNRDIIERGYIVIEDSVISALGSNIKMSKHGHKEIDAQGLWVLPGFVNSHVHLGETIYGPLITGSYSLSDYLHQTERLSKKFKPFEAERNVVASYSLLQLLISGCTTISGGRTSESAEHFKLRNVSGYMLMKSPKLKHYSENFQAKFLDLLNNKNSPLTNHSIFIHSLSTIDKTILRAISKLMIENPNIRLMIHIAEDKGSKKAAREVYKLSPVEVLQSAGLLSNKTLLIHANNLTSKEFKMVQQAGAHVIHCLSSNMKVANKTIDLQDLLSKNINIAIATDGVVTGSDFSILREAGNAYRYHNRFNNKSPIPAQRFLDMITINPARALGLDKTIGSIEVGKEADIVFLKPPLGVTKSNRVNQLISYASLVEVRGVMVAGKHILRESRVLNHNKSEIENRFNELLAQASH